MSRLDATSEEILASLLKGSGMTLAAAESCTGGNISHRITTVPGSSEYYLGSVTSYSPLVKQAVLGVSPDLIRDEGIVSAGVAASMAHGVRRVLGSDFSVATTGWADRYGDEREPAGTCWVAVCGPAGTKTLRVRSEGSRTANIEHFTTAALDFLGKYIADAINISDIEDETK